MAERLPRKEVKVGVKEGDGPPPGYKWNVAILEVSYHNCPVKSRIVAWSYVPTFFRLSFWERLTA